MSLMNNRSGDACQIGSYYRLLCVVKGDFYGIRMFVT
jgi:hypothetical protein